MKNTARMNTLLAELGYTFSPSVVIAECQKACGKSPSEGVQNWFAAAAPHLVLAYKKSVDFLSRVMYTYRVTEREVKN
ncbi:MAG: hypothetical protein HFE88_03985 [Acutalibacter sp.]|nr:hypothetical protein [Acutalibacter sp.]